MHADERRSKEGRGFRFSLLLFRQTNQQELSEYLETTGIEALRGLPGRITGSRMHVHQRIGIYIFLSEEHTRYLRTWKDLLVSLKFSDRIICLASVLLPLAIKKSLPMLR